MPGTKKKRYLEIPLSTKYFESADQYIEQWMKQNHISSEIVMETRLLFEALFHDLIAQGFGEETLLRIRPRKTFGELSIKLGFEGKSYVPDETDPGDLSPELRILQGYNDKVGFRYQMGYNSISIVVKRNHSSALMHCFFGILLAIIAYLPINAFVSAGDQAAFNHQFITPLIKQFSNAMLMIGAPVTLFSLIKNLADIYIVSEKSSSGRKLQVKTIVTSLIAVALAFWTSVVIATVLYTQRGLLAGKENTVVEGMSVPELISSIVPSNILEPFITLLPFPIIIVALLTTYALCSVGKYFDVIQKGINICFTLLSKMLNAVMYTLPFFCFLSILTALLENGFGNLVILGEYVLLIFLSLGVIMGFYLIRLMIGKVKLGPFLKHMPHMIAENFKINSAIDAVPFNIRYCARKLGYNRKRLSAKLPILAETNQDGNCFLIMLIAMIFIFLLGIEVSWLHIVGIAVLVLFLSFGAPNQPGSIVIGMLIVTFFLQADKLIAVAIFAEVFFGSIQNIINVIGDIVTVAIEEQKEERLLKAA
jgi:Na+/H+-dicarboxylate symporter